MSKDESIGGGQELVYLRFGMAGMLAARGRRVNCRSILSSGPWVVAASVPLDSCVAVRDTLQSD